MTAKALLWWLLAAVVLALFLYFSADIMHLWVVHGRLVRL